MRSLYSILTGNVILEARCLHLVGGTFATCSWAELNDLELIVCLKVEITFDYSIK